MYKMTDGTYVTRGEVLDYIKSNPGVGVLFWVGKYTSTEYRRMKGLHLGPRGRPAAPKVAPAPPAEYVCPRCGTRLDHAV